MSPLPAGHFAACPGPSSSKVGGMTEFLSPRLAQLGALKETHWIILPAATWPFHPPSLPGRALHTAVPLTRHACTHARHRLAQVVDSNNLPFATPCGSDVSIIQRHLAKTLGNSFAESGSVHKLMNSQTIQWSCP